jgi:lipopolysaccharide/colanic/teichoic acid biosynthesis glycosyltransferase
MSLVGPRPPLPEEVDRYDWLYRKRLSIKPGITCLWQVSGRSHLSFKRWMELDQEYIQNWSLWLDIKILAKTIPAVLSRRGAS